MRWRAQDCKRVGKGVTSVQSDELRRNGLALCGMARDRTQNGAWSLDADVWVDAADIALSTVQAAGYGARLAALIPHDRQH